MFTLATYSTAATVVAKVAVESFAVHQFNSSGSIHTLALLRCSQGIYPKQPKLSVRRWCCTLWRVVKTCFVQQDSAGEVVSTLHVRRLSDRGKMSKTVCNGFKDAQLGSWTEQKRAVTKYRFPFVPYVIRCRDTWWNVRKKVCVCAWVCVWETMWE